MEAQIHRGARHVPGFGEAMHHAADLIGPFLAHDGERVLGRATGMNHQRFATFTRSANVCAEPLSLPLKIAVQTVVIEPGFTNRLYLGVLRSREQIGDRRFFNVFIVGMHTRRCVNIRVPFRQGNDRWPLRHGDADAHCV